MDAKELLTLLDLGGPGPDPPAPSGVMAAPEADEPAADARPTALVVDEWGLRRGRDLVAESDRLRAAAKQ